MPDSDYTDDESEYDSPSSTRAVIMDALLAPLRALVSKSALRLYINALLFMGATTLLVGISTIAYGIFYFNFIPTIGLEREVHLQFGNGNPWGTATFESEFIAQQPYDVTVILELPRTPSNLETGNFMLDLTLYASRPASAVLPISSTIAPIAHARRPALLTYASPLVDVAQRTARLPFYVVGWKREAEVLEVSIMEELEFDRGMGNLPQSLRLEIQSDLKMQVYFAKVEFRARLTGLRWLMYRWKITSFVVFASLFWFVSVGSASLTWLALTWVLQPATIPKTEISDEPQGFVKDESDGDSSSGETFRVKKEEAPESSLVHSLPAEDEAGMGSGLESAEARGLQRRRSHLTQQAD
ncbi:hypothetical protein PENANT_c009G04338 [Penicillium antarcticum]|uniref:Seipin n=1 Tax=Penicillium antarcticum TaxID=416450 RepID=A0A1V6Q9K5_9EURO|nr:hypothetical protein PENANT_c009G04338 [Penicillium antarcticum]